MPRAIWVREIQQRSISRLVASPIAAGAVRTLSLPKPGRPRRPRWPQARRPGRRRGAGITEHRITIARARAATSTAERTRDRMKAKGDLHEINQAFRVARAADPSHPQA
jgi:hypothetical protein